MTSCLLPFLGQPIKKQCGGKCRTYIISKPLLLKEILVILLSFALLMMLVLTIVSNTVKEVRLLASWPLYTLLDGEIGVKDKEKTSWMLLNGGVGGEAAKRNTFFYMDRVVGRQIVEAVECPRSSLY